MSKEIAEDYASSLGDLTVNSKPLINMLTILAEENIDHAGVIVDTVEKHLEKVPAEIKLPVLYLVDSIIKNVGGAYTQKFAQSIVNMFTRTFKQVDEKVRAQMFKLRETWHEVFPATKLYSLDVKVNLIDPAWPIQAQPHQANIHVNPNFLKKPLATPSTTAGAPAPAPAPAPVPVPEEEENMRSIVAKQEQELLLLKKTKIELELRQARRQLEIAEKTAKKQLPPATAPAPPTMPVALVNPVVAPVAASVRSEVPVIPAKQRLGPPVNKPLSGARIAPVSGLLASARRDPRLARRQQAVPPTQAPPVTRVPPIAPNVFDIKPLERNVTVKRKNVITIDVKQDVPPEAHIRDPRRHDPRLQRRDDRQRRDKNRSRDDRNKKSDLEKKRDEIIKKDEDKKVENQIKLNENNDKSVNDIMDKLQIADPKKINKLPPIPKIVRNDVKDKEKQKEVASPNKKRKDSPRIEKKKKRDNSSSSKDSSSSSSPEKKVKDRKEKTENSEKTEINRTPNNKDEKMEVDEQPAEPEVIAFKKLNNYHKECYMRRNKEKSESPEKNPEVKKVEEEKPVVENESSNVPDVIVENKDIDLRVLSAVPPLVAEVKPLPIAQKRSSTETLESKPNKKNKIDKFDILFGSEDVDLRQLPQVEEIVPPPPPIISEAPEVEPNPTEDTPQTVPSPKGSPKKDWNEVKEKELKKTPSKLDLVRWKLAEATKGKDRLGRQLRFSKSPSIERERRRTLSTEDVDLRTETPEEYDVGDHKKTISIIMSQAKEQFNDGQLDKNQYNTLMFQVMQLNEKLKLKEAKQRESLEISKRKLKAAHLEDENHKPSSPEHNNEHNKFGDIDERIKPPLFLDTPPDSQGFLQDSDMRVPPMLPNDIADGSKTIKEMLPMPPMMPMMMPPFPLMWRGGQARPRMEDFGPRRMRGPAPPPFARGKFDKRGIRGPIDSMIPPLPVPKWGMYQGDCPLTAYDRVSTPPPLGASSVDIPPTDFRLLEYIDQDPMKTIQIDGIHREIRFYGETAIVMLDWDDPREITFLPGSRRVTFDNKDSIVLSFNEGYRQVEIDDQVFEIRFGAPTRELYINGRWFECLFGGPPMGVMIDGKPRLIHIEGPLPQVDIRKEKRIDLVAGKINLIIDATHMCPIFLDAKVQKFRINNDFFTIRFVDALRTVLINEVPFQVEFGGLPRPIFVGNKKHFIRFSVLPRHVKPGHMEIANMEGSGVPAEVTPPIEVHSDTSQDKMVVEPEPLPAPNRTPSPEGVSQGLDMLASVMPTDMAPSSGSAEYVSSEPLFVKPDKIPGLETPSEEKPETPKFALPILENINVNDLFAKLVATGIVQLPSEPKKEETNKEDKVEEPKPKQNEDRNVVHRVDLLRPETLRVKQPGLVSRLYGGMQCSGCGTRFPPEHTVRYSQHLDWHFRQNRRERDSARRAHSRHWHYDLADWVQYEEVEDLEEREKSWFETGGAEGEVEGPVEVQEETPSVPAGAPVDQFCAMCGDKFDQFYNEDKEEWHLRKAVRHEDNNYHPLCFEDYKASQAKVEPANDSVIEVIPEEKTEEVLEIKESEEVKDSDDESDVEVVDPKPEEPPAEPLEIDEEGEEDDVVLEAVPVEEVVVEDDADTDDETTAERAERDELAKIDFSKIKVKQEPVDPDDEPIITAEEEAMRTSADTTHTTVLSSIDGNVQLDSASTTTANIPFGGIRINISKSIPTSFVTNNIDDKLEDISVDDEPLPPGEEPELEYKLKPNLEGIQFSRQPPVRKGNELSGLCSIM